MMKASLLFGFVPLALLPLTAETAFTVNQVYEGPVVTTGASAALTISETAIDAAHTPVLSATLFFTRPTERPAYSDVATEKLAIAADTDGTLLLADGTTKNWIDTGYPTVEGTGVPVTAIGKAVNGTLTFEVTLGTGDAAVKHTVTSPAAGTALSALTFSGDGRAEDLTLAIVDTTIIPAAESGTQDAAQIVSYVTWLNDPAKGGALDDGATDAAKSDAFAMNVGGKPKLEITAITPATDTTPGTVTVKGTYTKPTGTDADAPLDAINGKLYITYAETLSGTPQSKVADISIQADKSAVITLPDGARFVKAHVALTLPPAEL